MRQLQKQKTPRSKRTNAHRRSSQEEEVTKMVRSFRHHVRRGFMPGAQDVYHFTIDAEGTPRNTELHERKSEKE